MIKQTMSGAGCPHCQLNIESRVQHILVEMFPEQMELIKKGIFKVNSLGLVDYSATRLPIQYRGWMDKEITEYEKYQKFVRPENRNTAESDQMYQDIIANLRKILWCISRFSSYGSPEWHKLNALGKEVQSLLKVKYEIH